MSEPISPESIRVLIVDDHPATLQGTRAFLSPAPDILVVGEAARGEDALAEARALLPDVVLLDIRLEGKMNGIEVARVLRQDLPSIRIVILTGHDDEHYVRALFAIGVDGYLLKTARGPELIEAVRSVVRGIQVVSREIVERAPSPGPRSGIAANPNLSERECAVLALLARGARNKEIAQTLGIKTSTVETHISNAMAKLGARSRTEMMSRAVQRGVITPDQ